MKINNRKGFTLIELLATIAIIGLVVGGTTFGIVSIVKSSKEKALAITAESIKKDATTYSVENLNSEDWKDLKYNTNENYRKYKYYCITIEELMNKGFIKTSQKEIESNFNLYDYVVLLKDKVTSVIEKEEIISYKNPSNSEISRVCTNEIWNEKFTTPEIGTGKTYTDEINAIITNKDDVKAETPIISYECLYGETSNNLNKKKEVVDGNCQISGLENNTNQYTRICMTTQMGSYICSNTMLYPTKDFIKPTIEAKVTRTGVVKYNDENVINPGHYFNSNQDGISATDVYKCTLDSNNIFSCESTATKTIEKNTWYKTTSANIDINYGGTFTKVLITARITDRSNNYSEVSKTISLEPTKVTIYYSANGGTVTGKTSAGTWTVDSSDKIKLDGKYVTKVINYGEMDSNKDGLLNYNNSAYLNITKKDYSVDIGKEWICLEGCTENGKIFNQYDQYQAKDFCDAESEDCTVTLGVNWRKPTKVTIYYSANGGTVTDKTSAGTWTVDDSGKIKLNGKYETKIINYGEKDSSDGGLNNYNNPSYLNITNTGYTVDIGKEWICLEGCTENGKIFNQYDQYQAKDFCNAENKDCAVTLGVNWKKKSGFEGETGTTAYKLKTLNMFAWTATSSCLNQNKCDSWNCNSVGVIPSGTTIYFKACDKNNSNSNAKFAYVYVKEKDFSDRYPAYNYLIKKDSSTINACNNAGVKLSEASLVKTYNNEKYLYVRIPIYCTNESCGNGYVTIPEINC